MLRRLGLLLCLPLFACDHSDTVTIGFVGSLTGPTADIGSQARNGTILAVEHWNETGGINGKTIELVTKDDKNEPDTAQLSLNALVELDVAGIIGPTSSSNAEAIIPLANKAQVPIIGTTVTSDQFNDQDDYFFRPAASTRSGTEQLSDFLSTQFSIQHYAIITDLSNSAFTGSWKAQFGQWMREKGVEPNFEQDFVSGDNLALLDVSQQLALMDTDLIVLVTNARDSALLIKQIRSINTNVPIVTSEWAGTDEFLRLIGRDGEGLIIPRYINDASDSERFRLLQVQYEDRFQQRMGYAALLGYNASQLLLTAMAHKDKKQSIKEYLLTTKVFDGVLADFELNEFGDEVRNAFYFITEVREGQFMTLEP